MRMLKKSKQAAAHAGSLQQAADAVERQTNMMEDVSLQTQIASALEATMGPMKTSKKALASVEKVADEAGDIRDLNEDIQAALAQLNDGSSLALDDDELEAELAGMLHEESQEQNTVHTENSRTGQGGRTHLTLQEVPINTKHGSCTRKFEFGTVTCTGVYIVRRDQDLYKLCYGELDVNYLLRLVNVIIDASAAIIYIISSFTLLRRSFSLYWLKTSGLTTRSLYR